MVPTVMMDVNVESAVGDVTLHHSSCRQSACLRFEGVMADAAVGCLKALCLTDSELGVGAGTS